MSGATATATAAPRATENEVGRGTILGLAAVWVAGLGAIGYAYAQLVPFILDRCVEMHVPLPKLSQLMLKLSNVLGAVWPVALPLGAAMILLLPRRDAARVGVVLLPVVTVLVIIVLGGTLLMYRMVARAH